ASFTPFFFDDFEAYIDGVSLSAGKPFGAAGRTVVSSAKARHGRQSARMAIHAGDKGGFGRWGGIIPIEPALPRGSEIWVRLYVLWPQDFEFSASPWMKFIRLHNRTASGKNGGYNDLYVDNADGAKSVLRTIKETHDRWKIYDGPALLRDRWECYEVYLAIDHKSVDAGGEGRFRVWRDDELIFDRTDVPTINTADGVIDYLYLFTYWNNEAPPANHVFIDDLTIATSASPPPCHDAFGNRRIGDWMPE
ncbi:MAG: polysaccharide lyase, partial [Planctomycetes bacterium]|nr:polysaccharide lyase [Planctomycetota bacterium]